MKSLKDTIFELMRAPKEESDFAWLKRSMQTAIKLEFSTLPPYLLAVGIGIFVLRSFYFFAL
jgi:hypothetical protein